MEFIKKVFNFDNIGQKIKNATKWYCWIMTLLIWIATPIVFIVSLSDGWGEDGICILVLLSGAIAPCIIWVSCWLLYGYGELIDNTGSPRQNSCMTPEIVAAHPQADVERIRKVENLRAKGLITEEEYQAVIRKG